MISGVGFQELVLIFLLVLIVFGPKRIPELMSQAGRIMRELRRIAWDFRTAVELESLDRDTQHWDEDTYGVPPKAEPSDKTPDQVDDSDHPDSQVDAGSIDHE